GRPSVRALADWPKATAATPSTTTPHVNSTMLDGVTWTAALASPRNSATDWQLHSVHSVQIVANVPTVFTARPSDTRDSKAALPSALRRPRWDSHRTFSNTSAARTPQKSMSCQVKNNAPRSQNHW